MAKPKIYQQLKQLFLNANSALLTRDGILFDSRAAERTLCGALMLHLYDILRETTYAQYYVDVEYNRNKGGKIKTISKTILGTDLKVIPINCDLIVHSRGEIIKQDNLIAIEMKKSTRPESEKDSDRERLRCLTKDSFDDVWSFDGKTLPEHVCRYIIGIYYEVNYRTREILLEYYYKGEKDTSQTIHY